MSPTREELERRFNHHKPDGPSGEKLTGTRTACLELALKIVETTPFSREQSIALTKLEEVMFWANAGIARPKA